MLTEKIAGFRKDRVFRILSRTMLHEAAVQEELTLVRDQVRGQTLPSTRCVFEAQNTLLGSVFKGANGSITEEAGRKKFAALPFSQIKDRLERETIVSLSFLAAK